jgi:hypothetical protein
VINHPSRGIRHRRDTRLPVRLASPPVRLPVHGKTGPRMPATRAGHLKRAIPSKTHNIMKTILTLIAAASVAALSSTALAGGKACEKCCKDNCAACCKAKGKECGKDCCKGE